MLLHFLFKAWSSLTTFESCSTAIPTVAHLFGSCSIVYLCVCDLLLFALNVDRRQSMHRIDGTTPPCWFSLPLSSPQKWICAICFDHIIFSGLAEFSQHLRLAASGFLGFLAPGGRGCLGCSAGVCSPHLLFGSSFAGGRNGHGSKSRTPSEHPNPR